MAVKKVAKKSAFNEKADMRQDKRDTRGLSPKQMSAFKKADAKMDKKKGLTNAMDRKMDRKLISQIKKSGRGK